MAPEPALAKGLRKFGGVLSRWERRELHQGGGGVVGRFPAPIPALPGPLGGCGRSRLGKPSAKANPAEEVERMLDTLPARFGGRNAQRFHEHGFATTRSRGVRRIRRRDYTRPDRSSERSSGARAAEERERERERERGGSRATARCCIGRLAACLARRPAGARVRGRRWTMRRAEPTRHSWSSRKERSRHSDTARRRPRRDRA